MSWRSGPRRHHIPISVCVKNCGWELGAFGWLVHPWGSATPRGGASGAVGALGVRHTLERPFVREPGCHGPPQLHVELGAARPHPRVHTGIVLLAVVGLDVDAADHV